MTISADSSFPTYPNTPAAPAPSRFRAPLASRRQFPNNGETPPCAPDAPCAAPLRPYPPAASRFAAVALARRSRSTRCRSLPVAVRGISSALRNVTCRGHL